jgi:hypothetical protein
MQDTEEDEPIFCDSCNNLIPEDSYIQHWEGCRRRDAGPGREVKMGEDEKVEV